ncbi:hypothetical protein ALP86_00580 [Pseudomonas amygdali pv. mori]|nr:hypothetical protein ALP86_00580 [Pseudomonas amygdali pv. mori]
MPAGLALIGQARHVAVDQAEKCYGLVHTEQLSRHFIGQNPAKRPACQPVRTAWLDLPNTFHQPRRQAFHGAQLLLAKANPRQAVDREVALQVLSKDRKVSIQTGKVMNQEQRRFAATCPYRDDLLSFNRGCRTLVEQSGQRCDARMLEQLGQRQ